MITKVYHKSAFLTIERTADFYINGNLRDGIKEAVVLTMRQPLALCDSLLLSCGSGLFTLSKLRIEQRCVVFSDLIEPA